MCSVHHLVVRGPQTIEGVIALAESLSDDNCWVKREDTWSRGKTAIDALVASLYSIKARFPSDAKQDKELRLSDLKNIRFTLFFDAPIFRSALLLRTQDSVTAYDSIVSRLRDQFPKMKLYFSLYIRARESPYKEMTLGALESSFVVWTFYPSLEHAPAVEQYYTQELKPEGFAVKFEQAGILLHEILDQGFETLFLEFRRACGLLLENIEVAHYRFFPTLTFLCNMNRGDTQLTAAVKRTHDALLLLLDKVLLGGDTFASYLDGTLLAFKRHLLFGDSVRSLYLMISVPNLERSSYRMLVEEKWLQASLHIAYGEFIAAWRSQFIDKECDELKGRVGELTKALKEAREIGEREDIGTDEIAKLRAYDFKSENHFGIQLEGLRYTMLTLRNSIDGAFANLSIDRYSNYPSLRESLYDRHFFVKKAGEILDELYKPLADTRRVLRSIEESANAYANTRIALALRKLTIVVVIMTGYAGVAPLVNERLVQPFLERLVGDHAAVLSIWLLIFIAGMLSTFGYYADMIAKVTLKRLGRFPQHTEPRTLPQEHAD